MMTSKTPRPERVWCPHCEISSPRSFQGRCPACLRPLPPRKQRTRHVDPPWPTARRTPSGAPALHPKLVRLGRRDRWRCWLCDEPVDPKATGERAPTRDHVIPRAKGGGNSLSNLRLAHADCNRRRGMSDPPPDALARVASSNEPVVVDQAETLDVQADDATCISCRHCGVSSASAFRGRCPACLVELPSTTSGTSEAGGAAVVAGFRL